MIIAVLNPCGIHILGRGTAMPIGVNLSSGEWNEAAIKTKSAYAD